MPGGLYEHLSDVYDSVLIQMSFLDNGTIKRAANVLRADPDTEMTLLYDVLWEIAEFKKSLGFSLPKV